LALSGLSLIRFSFFERPLKSHYGRREPMKGFKFVKESIMSSSDFKGLSPTTTPFGKRKFTRIVELTISKVTTLSTQKMKL